MNEQATEPKLSITDQLKEPFDKSVIHWRVGATNAKSLGVKTWEATKGIALAYLDARDVMKRLDEVCGDNWQARAPYKGYCEVGLLINGEWLWRGNGAGETEVEGEKGQYSDAFKRAAVLWGIGRYLYYLPNTWCDLDNGKIKKPPALPSWATPEGYHRFKPGEKEAITTQVKEFLISADELGLKQIYDDYGTETERMKFWSLFNSTERTSIKAILGI